MLRFLFGFHPTRPHGKGRFRLSPVPASCSCLRFMVASSWLHTGLASAAIHPCQAHPVALRAPSDPADVILSINVLIYDPPPPSTLISRSGLSQGCWHRGHPCSIPVVSKNTNELKTSSPGRFGIDVSTFDWPMELVHCIFDYYTKLDFSPANNIHKIHALRMVSASSALSSFFCYIGLES